MSKTIDIGTVIDLDDLIESRMLIQANSGGGKSGVARVTMEESVGKVPFIVLDKKGEYYTLKEKFNDILVIGGRNGDIPISMQAAPKLAKFIIGHQLTVVVDMSLLESDEQRAIFIRDFLKGMMNLGEEYWTYYLVFVEEAHVWCGQQDKMVSGKYVKLLMSEGRKMGYCGILITQRISKLHKDAAAECNNKFIGRTFLDLDINRSAAEMGLVGQDKFKLRDLKPKHFWAFGTSIHPHHVHEVVIKNAQTKFPKAGVKINLANRKPTDKIKKALAKLNELPAEAAKELSDIKELQGEVKRLNAELKKKPIATSAPIIKEDSRVPLMQAKIKGLQKQANQWMKHAKDREFVIQKIYRQCEGLPQMNVPEIDLSDIPVHEKDSPVARQLRSVGIPPVNEKKKPAVTGGSENGQLPIGEKAILIACAQFGHAMDRNQLTVLTGYKRSSRDAYIARLKIKGYLQDSGSGVESTDAGISALGNDYEPLPTGTELQDYWLNRLPVGEKAILQVLIDNHPNPVTRDEISNQTPYQRSSRDAYIARMASKELVIQVGRGEVKASDNLFN